MASNFQTSIQTRLYFLLVQFFHWTIRVSARPTVSRNRRAGWMRANVLILTAAAKVRIVRPLSLFSNGVLTEGPPLRGSNDFLHRDEFVRDWRRVRCASLVCGFRWYGSLLLRSRIFGERARHETRDRHQIP